MSQIRRIPFIPVCALMSQIINKLFGSNLCPEIRIHSLLLLLVHRCRLSNSVVEIRGNGVSDNGRVSLGFRRRQQQEQVVVMMSDMDYLKIRVQDFEK